MDPSEPSASLPNSEIFPSPTTSELKQTIIFLRDTCHDLEDRLTSREMEIDQLRMAETAEGDHFEMSNTIFELKSQLNDLKLTHLNQKQQLIREYEKKIVLQKTHFEKEIKALIEGKATKTQELEKSQEEQGRSPEQKMPMSESRDKETLSQSGTHNQEDIAEMKRINKRLIQQNKEHLEKLYVALGEVTELKEYIEDLEVSNEKLVRQLGQRDSLHGRELKEYESIIESYKSLKQQNRGRSKPSNISSESGSIIRMDSGVKQQVASLVEEIQRMKVEANCREVELNNLRDIIQEREDDNRDRRNQLLTKDQEIFRYKAMIGLKDKLLEQHSNNIQTLNTKIQELEGQSNNLPKKESQANKPIELLSEVQPYKIGVSDIQGHNDSLQYSDIRELKSKTGQGVVSLEVENTKLKEDNHKLAQLLDGTIGDSKREQQLAIAKHERDRLFTQKVFLKEKQSSFQDKIEELSNQIAKYRQKYQSDQLTIIELTQNKQQLERELDSLQIKRNVLLNQREGSIENSRLISQSGELLSENQQSKRENQESKSRGSEQHKNFSPNEQWAAQFQHSQDNGVNTMQQQLLKTRVKLTETHQELEELKAKYKLLEEQSGQKVGSCGVTNWSSNKLVQENGFLVNEKDYLTVQVQELEVNLDRTRKECQAAKRENSSRGLLIREQETKLEQLSTTIGDLNADLARLKKDKRSLLEEAKNTNLKVQDKQRLLEEKEEEGETLKRDITQLKTRLEKEASSNSKARQDLQKRASQIETENDQLKGELQRKEEERRSQEQTERRLNNTVEEYRQEKQKFKNRVQELEHGSQNKDKGSNITVPGEQNIRLKNMNEELQSQCNQMRQRIQGLESTILDLKESHNPEDNTSKRLQESIIKEKGLPIVDNNLYETNRQLSATLESSKADNTRLNTELQQLKSIFNERLQTLAIEIQQMRNNRSNNRSNNKQDKDIQHLVAENRILQEKCLKLELEGRNFDKYSEDRRSRKERGNAVDVMNLRRQVELLNQIIIEKDKEILRFGRGPQPRSERIPKHNKDTFVPFVPLSSKEIPKNSPINGLANSRQMTGSGVWRNCFEIYPVTQGTQH